MFNQDLRAVKTAYHTAYGRDLKQDLQIYSVGDIIDILVALVDGSREDGNVVREEMAKADAEALKSELENGFPDENITFKTLLTKTNTAQLKLTCKKYQEVSCLAKYLFLCFSPRYVYI